MPCIALTGGMGNGKSAAVSAFAELGVKTLDADMLAHLALDNDATVQAQVSDLLGADVFKDGKAQRKEIAKKVFANKNLLQALENILHPVVENMWKSQVKDGELLIVEVPLLFEKNLEKKFDLCISVYCSNELRMERLKRRGMSESEIHLRDTFQIRPEKKASLADIVLFNESTTDFLKAQVRKIVSRLI